MTMASQKQLVCARDLGTLKLNWLEKLFLCQSEFVLEFIFFPELDAVSSYNMTLC